MILIQKQKYKGGKKKNGLLMLSGAKLATELDIPIYTPRIVPRGIDSNTPIINWGLSEIPWVSSTHNVINECDAIKLAANKLKTFNELKEVDVPIPTFTTSREAAENWLAGDNKRILFCRTKLTGSCGEGIVIAREVGEIVDAPLYVEYIKKQLELRVHVVNSRVIHTQQKRRLTTAQLEERGIDNREKLIRNKDNGYIFSTNIDHISEEVIEELYRAAIDSVMALGLDFGAVDLIVTKDRKVYVLEVNTAPGLEGTTLTKYKEAFQQEFMNDQ